jgi:hypothetical protein
MGDITNINVIFHKLNGFVGYVKEKDVENVVILVKCIKQV